jgi:ATP-dependent Clp protease ATP-binding subunit ClpB
MTSNLGSDFLLEGIGPDGEISEEARNSVSALLSRTFRPEFLNRLDEIVYYKPLTKDDIGRIIQLLIASLRNRLKEKSLDLEITPAAVEKIIEEGYDPLYGARPLKRYLQAKVETVIARAMLSGDFGMGDTIVVDTGADGGFTTRRK